MKGLSATAEAPGILDHMTALADPTRARLLLVLERHELTVSELCAVLQLPQSTVSRHLKALADSAWVVSRSEATSNRYRMVSEALAPAARRLWLLVREQLSAASAQDEGRLQSVLRERRSKSQEFFSASAGEWDRLRSDLFGPRFHVGALLGLVEPSWVVGDIGCGTGEVAASLAPFVSHVVAIDGSPEMLQSAAVRLSDLPNVEVRRGDLELLPLDDGALDAATVFLVLHHVPAPERAIREVARVLRPGGRLLIVDMLPHDRERYRQQMGHVWLGFSEGQIASYLEAAGFEAIRLTPLPIDARAKGPLLFAATARRGGRNS